MPAATTQLTGVAHETLRHWARLRLRRPGAARVDDARQPLRSRNQCCRTPDSDSRSCRLRRSAAWGPPEWIAVRVARSHEPVVAGFAQAPRSAAAARENGH